MTVEPRTIERFAELFDGRRDAIGLNDGGCHRTEPLDDIDWYESIRLHLEAQRPDDMIGVYPLRDDDTVRWGCVDFDEGEADSLIHALNLRLCLARFGIEGHVERSRSKGYHVWVFLADWTPASLVRRALTAACQIVDAPTKEVNPKQTTTDGGTRIGNYVRLPYGGQRAEGRQCVLVAGGPHGSEAHLLRLEAFVALARGSRAKTGPLEELADLWRDPRPKPAFDVGAAPRAVSGQVPNYLQVLIDGGPGEGADRSDWLWRFAREAVERGLDEPTAWEALQEADWRWGKFMQRGASGERTLREMLAKAYGQGA